MRYLIALIIALAAVACGGSSGNSPSDAPQSTQSVATSTNAPTSTATTTPASTPTSEPTDTPRPTRTPRPTPPPIPTSTPAPTATPTVAPTATPIDEAFYGEVMSTFVINSLEASKAIVESFAVAEGDRGQFWEINIMLKAQVLRDQHDQFIRPAGYVMHPPTDNWKSVYEHYARILAAHAAAFDAYQQDGDFDAWRAAFNAFIDEITVVANDIADLRGL